MHSNGQLRWMFLLGRYVPALVGYARVAEPQGPDCWTAAGDTLALRRAARSLEFKSEISSGFFVKAWSNYDLFSMINYVYVTD